MRILIFFLALSIVSCASQKHITTKTQSTDSLSELRDSISMLTTENNRLTNENLELQYLGISFDTVRLHDTSRIFNTVYIKDGEIKAEGNLLKVVLSKSVLTKFVQEQSKTIDSLRLLKNKVEVRVETKYVDRKVKRSFLNFWWLLLIGFIGGWFAKSKIGKLSFLKFTI